MGMAKESPSIPKPPTLTLTAPRTCQSVVTKGPPLLPILIDLGYLDRLNLPATDGLHFFEPDPGRFACLRLAFEALEARGTMPAVTNAANEVAVARFLAEEISFLDIPATVEAAMKAHENGPYETFDELRSADAWARSFAANRPGRRPAA